MKDHDFNFKEIDEEGLETLNVISEANHFNEWTYNSIKSFCKGEILEIGSGIGNISKYFVENNYRITLSDLRQNYRETLSKTFGNQGNFNGVVNIDLASSDFKNQYPELIEKYDTVFALNVVEHIKDDSLVIRNCHYLLKENGILIILVPAYNSLMNSFDKELMHYRRYTSKSLKNLFVSNGFKTISNFYFNLAGIPAWYISGKLMNNKIIPSKQMKLYNRMVPVWKLLDKLVFNRAGLSVLCIGTKISQ